jgi:hypothetical protein
VTYASPNPSACAAFDVIAIVAAAIAAPKIKPRRPPLAATVRSPSFDAPCALIIQPRLCVILREDVVLLAGSTRRSERVVTSVEVGGVVVVIIVIIGVERARSRSCTRASAVVSSDAKSLDQLFSSRAIHLYA